MYFTFLKGILQTMCKALQYLIMKEAFQALVTTLGVMAVFDAVWLGVVAKSFYKKYIGFIMTDKPVWSAAILFYFIFAIGLTYFVVHPAWQQSWTTGKLLLAAGLFGLVTYATYDLTNQATLKNWPVTVTFVDLAWGTLLAATTSIITVAILKAIVK
jgi:uncharacterized membrane protein